MFKYKNDEELGKMSAEERNTYAEEKRTYEKDLQDKAIEKAIKESATAKDGEIQKAIKAVIDGLEKEESGISKAEFDEVVEKLNQLQETSETAEKNTDLFETIEKGLKLVMPKLKELAEKNSSSGNPFSMEVNVDKAAVNMLTTAFANAQSVTTPVSYVYQRDFAGPAEDVRAIEYILSLVSRGNTNKATLAIVDKVATEGTMEITAEGALKPLLSFSFVTKYSTAKKIAGRIKISEEALDDLPWLMSMIRSELMYQHSIALQANVLAAVNTIAPSFVAGSLAGTTVSPSNWDAVRAAIFAVKIASKGRFIPNGVLMASADIYEMGATKDKNDNYVIPPFVLPDGSRIEGVRIIEVSDGTSLTTGNIIVGDWRKLHLDNYKGFTVRIGQGIIGSATAANIVSDFEANMYTVIGESRFHIWNFTNEVSAFLKGSLASIKTAIELDVTP